MLNEKPYTLIHGDCLEEMRSLDSNCVDSIVCDPPYELGFMGKAWDNTGIAYNVELWREALRVLKPGGYLLAFGGSRTYHRLAVAVEDAGFEIRDQIMWIYGSGFPKSLDVSKAIDKMAGAQRTVISQVDGRGKYDSAVRTSNKKSEHVFDKGRPDFLVDVTEPATDEAKQWNGFGTALKPAHEPIVMARKPLEKGLTVAQNVLKWGTGAINVDGCRVVGEKGSGVWGTSNKTINPDRKFNASPEMHEYRSEQHALGRFPANLIHDGSDEIEAEFAKYGKRDAHGKNNAYLGTGNSIFAGKNRAGAALGDKGTASRFFYCAKASKKDRGENHHPTVKPTELMRYLCRLVTPPQGIVLDCFAGSGSTGKAARLEGFGFIGIEKDANYFEIAKCRIESALTREPLFMEATNG